MDSPNQTVSTDVALEIVADRRRRNVLQQLIANDDGVVRLEELVESAASTESRSPTRLRMSNEQLRLELRHVHLPKLADSDVIDYDERSETVRYYETGRLEKLVRFVATELR